MRIACLAVDATAVTDSRDEQEVIIPINSVISHCAHLMLSVAISFSFYIDIDR